MTHQDVKDELLALAVPEKAVFFKRFFKTGPGQYGEGDEFLGVTVPQQRIIAQTYRLLPPEETEKLVRDPFHECRLTGLIIWTNQAKRPGEENRRLIFDYYLRNKNVVNNWDLVDTSCPGIVGNYLLNKDRSVLYELARENHLWSQRIAMVSTLAFIRKNQFQDTFQIAELLLSHRHDLIHKAVGWMLREVGKKNPDALEEFLHDHAGRFPRTALRYAIERFDPARRKYYLDL
ncbi:DNA alkylation repair protein [Larkinella humicola]|uniref:DNA alkylation repair protein n=1 Tax=Larkinella humicola TaxID=2607654 RepID=A0A5N1JEZ0_9BACT|nr:DNA alkylation repair protein [Larkinella humicola]KAA9353956.1 DNA alkylation repair protein [Larkinella humicola]